MEKKGFGIEDSLCMYGVAIMMLIFHHLYCDPDRLQQDYFTIIPSGICMTIAIFCHICVAIYSYITGYGFSKKFDGIKDCNRNRLSVSYRIIFNSLIKFMIKYWIVLAVFFPIGVALGKINFDLKVFARSFVGLSNEYNNEWWYVKQYIKILIMLPVIDYIYVMISKYIREKKYFIPVLTCGGGIN